MGHSIIENQKNNYISVFIDMEHSLNINYIKNIGIIISSILIIQPHNGEQALDSILILSQSNCINLIILDSVSALVPKIEMNIEQKESQLGIQARLMSRYLRKIATIVSKNNTTLIFINQLRLKIGILFGNPEITSGGNALKYYSSIRIELKRLTYIRHGAELIGNKIRIKITKNKLSIPFKNISIDIIYGLGISKEHEIVDLAIKVGLIISKGKWLYFKME